MDQDYDHVATVLGRELRRARHAVRKRQRDVGAEIDLSQPSISRLELGGGGPVALDTWIAVARAVGRRLEFDLVDSDEAPGTVVAEPSVRCHRMVARTAAGGGWSAATAVRHWPQVSDLETVLTRRTETYRPSNEVAIVQVWHEITGVEPLVARLLSRVDEERLLHPDATIVSGLVVVPASHHDRRRITEVRDELRAALPAAGRDWYAALVNSNRRLPRGHGILWAFRHGDGLRPAPFLPGWVWTAPSDGPRFARRGGP